MPVTDIAMDVEGWSLESVGADPEDTHILTLYSGSVAVEVHLMPDDLLMLADAIEEALERLEDVPLDWTLDADAGPRGRVAADVPPQPRRGPGVRAVGRRR